MLLTGADDGLHDGPTSHYFVRSRSFSSDVEASQDAAGDRVRGFFSML